MSLVRLSWPSTCARITFHPVPRPVAVPPPAVWPWQHFLYSAQNQDEISLRWQFPISVHPRAYFVLFHSIQRVFSLYTFACLWTSLEGLTRKSSRWWLLGWRRNRGKRKAFQKIFFKPYKCACVLSRFSHVQLFATLWPVAYQALLSMEFSRQEYWSGWPCPPPGDLPNPGIEPASPALVGVFFTTNTTWEAHLINVLSTKK